MQLFEDILEYFYRFFISAANIYAMKVKADDVKQAERIIIFHIREALFRHHHHFDEVARNNFESQLICDLVKFSGKWRFNEPSKEPSVIFATIFLYLVIKFGLNER